VPTRRLCATRTEVVGEWCIDGSRDPDATTLRNGELVDNDTWCCTSACF